MDFQGLKIDRDDFVNLAKIVDSLLDKSEIRLYRAESIK